MVVVIANWPIKLLNYSSSSLFAMVTNFCIYKDIKFSRLLISINLAPYATPSLLPAPRCQTISNEKPNNEAEVLSEHDLKIYNVKTYLHIAVMLEIYQKIWNAFHEWFKLSLCSQRAGSYKEYSPKNMYILGSETVLNCYLQGPSMVALQFATWLFFPRRIGKRLPYCCCWNNNFPAAFFGRDMTLNIISMVLWKKTDH